MYSPELLIHIDYLTWEILCGQCQVKLIWKQNPVTALIVHDSLIAPADEASSCCMKQGPPPPFSVTQMSVEQPFQKTLPFY